MSATLRPPDPRSHASLAGYTVIYGGSFDPPHMSHQMSCLYLLECLGAQELWIIPSYTHPFGKVLADFRVRLEMCQLLAAPFAGRVQVSPVEQQIGGAGRTYDTLRHLQAAHPDRRLALAVGSDILADTPRWYRWSDIEAMVPVVVVGRAGYPQKDVPLELPALASRTVRERSRRGESLDGLVPASVARYIAEHGLYQAT